MSDPAVEAAKRAEQASGWWKSGYSTPWDSDYATDAAREALKPIRELHRPVKRYAHPDSGMDCLEDSKPWPCRTAKLIYTTEELER